MEKLKKLLPICILLALFFRCAYVHRRVIRALIDGDPMPAAPKWHCWCGNRRS